MDDYSESSSSSAYRPRGPQERPIFWPEDRRCLFAKGYEVELDASWPLIKDPEEWRNLPGDVPWKKRELYNDRRSN